MARKTARPGRTLWCSSLGLAIAYGLVALGGTWKPALGLDLQGGTRITLIAKGNPSPDEPRRGRRHHRPARQRLRCLRGRGDHAGQPVHRRRDPRQEPPRPRRHRQAPGAAALPPGRLQPRSRRPAVPPPAPAPGRRPTQRRLRRDRARAAAQRPAQRPARASRSASPRPRRRTARRCSRRSQEARRQPPPAPPARRPARRASRVRQPVGQPVAPAPTPPRGGPLVDQPLKWMTNPDPASVKAFNDFQLPARTAPRRSSTTTPQAAGHLRTGTRASSTCSRRR